jgi:hypothetical protein
VNPNVHGGPAFPSLKGLSHAPQYFNDSSAKPAFDAQSSGGMTLRDWFAGQAMMGMLASGNGEKFPIHQDILMAGWSYQAADAMLAAREASNDQ